MQLTPDTARAIVAPLYEALNEPGKKDVKALLEQATTPDFLSCGNEGECVGRDAVIARFTALGQTVPNLHSTCRSEPSSSADSRAASITSITWSEMR